MAPNLGWLILSVAQNSQIFHSAHVAKARARMWLIRKLLEKARRDEYCSHKEAARPCESSSDGCVCRKNIRKYFPPGKKKSPSYVIVSRGGFCVRNRKRRDSTPRRTGRGFQLIYLLNRIKSLMSLRNYLCGKPWAISLSLTIVVTRSFKLSAFNRSIIY